MKRALYLLAELSDRDFNWWVRVGKQKRIPKGTILIEEGQPIDALYLVLDGNLSVTAKVLEGKEIATLSSGEIVGEISFVDARPPSATVKAIEDTTVWAIPRSQLAAKLSQDTAFAAHFYHAIAAFLSDRIRGTVSRLGYSRYPQLNQETESETNTNPETLTTLELAKVRLDWLLNRLQDS
ncbi:MAG: cyclic nucleotide-binding domain-containing protein [Kovacikia sp.]